MSGADILKPGLDRLARRSADHDWNALAAALDENGFATLETLLTPAECFELVSLYGQDRLFRNHVHMARHGFGKGEYRYFHYPLPEPVGALRTSLYPHLAGIANAWNTRMNAAQRFPEHHADFLASCRASGQSRPTPLLLRYGPGDYNCLHQDLYGELVFPLQITVLLSDPGMDFTGGEFVLTEQRPRMQSRATVVPLAQGDAVIFAVNHRPVHGARGTHRVSFRHGVSHIRSGQRYALGIIFHDAP